MYIIFIENCARKTIGELDIVRLTMDASLFVRRHPVAVISGFDFPKPEGQTNLVRFLANDNLITNHWKRGRDFTTDMFYQFTG